MSLRLFEIALGHGRPKESPGYSMTPRFNLCPCLCAVVACLFLTACAVQQKKVVYDSIPAAETPSAQATADGDRVFRSLSRDYPIDAGSDRRRLLEEIFNHLARSADLDPKDWHVHLLYAPGVADARSVEGNYLFVWSGLFDVVKSQDELAGLLACEIAHALAGHTDPVVFTPASELLFGLTDVVTTIGLMVLTQGTLNIGGTGFTRWAYVEAADLDPVDRVYTAVQLEEMATIAFLMLDASRYEPEGLVDFWRRAGSNELPLQQVERLVRSMPPAERLAILEAAAPEALDGHDEDDTYTDGTVQTVDSGEEEPI